MSTGTTKLDVVVADVVPVNDLVTRFHFRRAEGGLLPTFSGGAHVVVEMRDGDISRLNPYSLMSSPLDTREYTISIRRDDVGRGGSLFMHRKVRPGDRMVVSYPVNLFSLDLRARKHLMIAGGIGITPFMAQTAQFTVVEHGRLVGLPHLRGHHVEDPVEAEVDRPFGDELRILTTGQRPPFLVLQFDASRHMNKHTFAHQHGVECVKAGFFEKNLLI